jgi:hypothetical protein
LALGARSPVLVPSDMYQGTFFRKNKSGPRTPRPPSGPPVLGSFVRSAEGLPSSTRNWPFRWPLSPTIPPQVIHKAMWAVNNWPGRWFWGLELHQRRHGPRIGPIPPSPRPCHRPPTSAPRTPLAVAEQEQDHQIARRKSRGNVVHTSDMPTHRQKNGALARVVFIYLKF